MELPSLLSLAPALLVIMLLFTYFSRRRRRLPPGPKNWPIVMLIKLFLNKPRFRWVLRLSEGKDITYIPFYGMPTIVVNCPELAREFLKKHDTAFASRPVTMVTEHASRGFKTTIVTPRGDQWKKMRRVLASEILSPSRLRWVGELRAIEDDHLVRYLYNHCKDSPVVDIRTTLRYYMSNVIRQMLFHKRHLGEGGRYRGPGKEDIEHTNSAVDVLDVMYAFCVSDFMPCLRWLDLDGHEKQVKKAMKVINQYHDPLIDEKVTRLRDGKLQSMQQEPEDMVDVMISLKDDNGSPLLTIEEVKAQTAELFIATIDNPPNLVERTLAEMLQNPYILQKATDELDRVVGKDRLVQESDLPKLVYIKACARETARLHPNAAFNLPHLSTCDAIVAGYFIPKGSQILLSRIGLGRNPKIWADPLKYDPDRHLNNGSHDVELAEPELRFITFSIGRRSCMGRTLGSLLTYMLLARIIQAFDWSVAPGESSVDIEEEKKSILLAKPLFACAKPRLSILELI